MRISKKGLSLIKSFEGLRLTVYKDVAGYSTVGYGHLLKVKDMVRLHAVGYDDEKGGVTGQISPAEADMLLADDVLNAEKSVTVLTEGIKLNQNQFDALVSFTFNLGSTALHGSTLLKKLKKGDYAAAAKEFLRWNRAGGKVVKGLTTRRQAEKALFEEK